MGVLIKNKINYTGSGDILNQPVIYSDSERCIGVWRDGKPLYQKTIHTTQIVRDITIIDISGLGCDEIFIVGAGTFKKHGTDLRYVQANGFYLSSDDKFQCYINKIANQIIILANDSSHSGDAYITIQYTKTTDIAGTGPWAPTGATPIHYSLEEQVIGTWIDGKPLYQKSFQFLNYRLESNDRNTITSLSSLNYDVICDIDAVMTNSTHVSYRKLNIYVNNTDQDVSLMIGRDGIDIYVRTTWSSPNIYITLKYTKTTD